VFGEPYQALHLVPCENGTLFSYRKYDDDTFRLKTNETFAIHGNGTDGENIVLSYVESQKSTIGKQQFELI
jgi:hypothetical protein